MKKSILLVSAAFLSLSAYAAQQCPEINGSFQNLQHSEVVAEIATIPTPEGVIYSFNGTNNKINGAFTIDGKVHEISGMNVKYGAGCSGNTVKISQVEPKVKGSASATFRVLNPHGDLQIIIGSGKDQTEDIMVKQAAPKCPAQ